jgi:predicted Ser/Thr protein kinase
VKILRGFAAVGRADKLILMYGPNGSAKSSIVRVLYDGLEHYSYGEEGMAFSFSWVFPHDAYDRKTLGIGPKATQNTHMDSYARLEQEQIGAIVRSELCENPLYLIPRAEREKLFDAWLSEAKTKDERQRLEICRESFLRAELSHKNSLIFDALMNNYGGDISKVLRHVRVERMNLSTRLRKGLVTIEPQLAVDAGMRQVTLDRSLANLPAALQSLNLFQLEGHLVDGNRGMIEFNDLLKRPLEHFKYLLSTSETGTLSLGGILVFLDTVFIGSTNDRQLEAFREHPEYNSFKARIELVKVPYLLRFSEEQKIYAETARKAAGKKEILPHTTRLLALWAVAARLKKPILKNKNALVTKILEALSPIEKAFIYDEGRVPESLNEEQRRELKGHIEELVAEHQKLPYYEGLLGPSARELKALLQLTAQNEQFPTLSPNAIFAELRELVKRPQDFEYLRQEPMGLYHNFEALIEETRKVWLDLVEEEMRESLDLEQSHQLRDFLKNYVFHTTHHVRGEKIRNRVTGKSEDPDASLMSEFEKLIAVPAGHSADFRKNIIARLGAWSVDNAGRVKGDELPYAEIFSDLMEKLVAHFREAQNSKVRSMGALLLDIKEIETLTHGSPEAGQLSESRQMLLKVYNGLQQRFGYGPKGAQEALEELVKARYV